MRQRDAEPHVSSEREKGESLASIAKRLGVSGPELLKQLNGGTPSARTIALAIPPLGFPYRMPVSMWPKPDLIIGGASLEFRTRANSLTFLQLVRATLISSGLQLQRFCKPLSWDVGKGIRPTLRFLPEELQCQLNGASLSISVTATGGETSVRKGSLLGGHWLDGWRKICDSGSGCSTSRLSVSPRHYTLAG